MKVLEYTLDGKFVKCHKDMNDAIKRGYDVDEIIKCVDNKQLYHKDKVWVVPSMPLGAFNKKLLIIRNQTKGK